MMSKNKFLVIRISFLTYSNNTSSFSGKKVLWIIVIIALFILSFCYFQFKENNPTDKINNASSKTLKDPIDNHSQKKTPT